MESRYIDLLAYSVFFRTDQPTTCPKCGNRTEILLDLSHTLNETQLHECLSVNCKKIFVEECY